MTNKQWIEANLKGKVKARALRAVSEQPEWDRNDVMWIKECFHRESTKEGARYWGNLGDANPDQYLPKNYIDVDHIVEPTEMIKDKFLVWLEKMIEFTREDGGMGREHWAFCSACKKYNELKK
jgi:hypothetical protein